MTQLVFILLSYPVDSAIHWINLYPQDSAICVPNTYPLNTDFSGG